MVVRSYAKKRRRSYFGLGKKENILLLKEKKDIIKNKKPVFITGIKLSKTLHLKTEEKKMRKCYKRKKIIYGKGSTVSVSHPYINKRNRLMLGEGEKKKNRI